MNEPERKLIGNTDAKAWAEEFVRLVKVKPSIATDEGTMLGWFANAIMAGVDWGMKIGEKRGIVDDLLNEILRLNGEIEDIKSGLNAEPALRIDYKNKRNIFTGVPKKAMTDGVYAVPKEDSK